MIVNLLTHTARLYSYATAFAFACGILILGCDVSEEDVFPAGFIWGTATSAYQAEGDCHNDWTEWEQIEGKIYSGERSGKAANHYEMYAEDLALASSLGNNAYRFSIEWSRIEPQRDQWDMNEVRHYHDVIDACYENGLKPIVTLHHFTHPTWAISPLHPDEAIGDWACDELVDEFVEFANFCAQQYGAKVDHWITINEPMVHLTHAFLLGLHPPGEILNLGKLQKGMANMLFAHARAYKAIKNKDEVDADHDGEASIVMIAKAMSKGIPYDDSNNSDIEAAERWNYIYNKLFLETLTDGYLDYDLDGSYDNQATVIPEGYYDELAGTLDWIGINYYAPTRLDSRYLNVPPFYAYPDNRAKESEPSNDMGWRIYPPGLYDVLEMAAGFDVPLLITENGMCDEDDDLRPAFIVSHLLGVLCAIEDGIDVRGYLYWALMDNFEWNSGFYPRFGLFYVDYENDFQRIETTSSQCYADIISKGCIDDTIKDKYGEIEY